MRPYSLLLITFLMACPASSQSFKRHNFTAGLGAAIPQGDLGQYYQDAFSWTFAYGFRPVSFFQIDLGWDGAYNSADVDDYYDSPAFGPIRIRDYQHYFPFGGRGILPLAKGKVQLFGGGGGAYIRYSEYLNQPSDYWRVDCPVCNSRDGFGWYALAGGDVALNQSQSLRLGVTVKMYRGETDGPSIGSIPPYRTHDKWLNTYIHLTFCP